MEKPLHAHLLFEQSGTFLRAFEKFGIPACDYDIQNQYGCTTIVTNLFKHIELAYKDKPSIFDVILQDDITMAFFPCTYFSEYNVNLFNGSAHNYRYMSRAACIDYIIDRARERDMFYILLIKLCAVFERRGLRLIVENPFGVNHYLYNNFPFPPTIVDFNRRARGDYYRKPTQYIFINCSPANGMTFQRPRNVRRIADIVSDHHGNKARSEISPEYAENFIRDFVLGQPTINSQLSMF